MKIIFLLKKIKNIIFKPQKVYSKIKEILNLVSDTRLRKIIKINDKQSNKIIKIYDFGSITRYRATTFFHKEPETIKWINSFKQGEIFLDVGANIGIYSLYAGSKGITTIAVEPDALNNALLNLNINLNLLSKKILAFSLAFHEEQKYSTLNIKKIQWGGALNSFDNCKDYLNKTYLPSHKQGVFGDTIDNFLNQLEKKINHIKIDVDGNEYFVLRGAKNALDSKFLKTILIELNTNHPDYKKSIDLIVSMGFVLSNKFNLDKYKTNNLLTTFNHIFIKN